MSEVAVLDEKEEVRTRSVLGFWIYLMTDCILFASLFATYAVLRHNTSTGPSGRDVFSLPYVLTETLILLTSSFSCGMAVIAAQTKNLRYVVSWLVLTFILGASFLAMELTEFHHLVRDGDSWQRSGFLSSYFTLVGTHGLHITVGLLWLVIIVVVLFKRGFSESTVRKLTMFSLFWHFLDVIWIFIFTIVYLMGSVSV